MFHSGRLEKTCRNYPSEQGSAPAQVIETRAVTMETQVGTGRTVSRDWCGGQGSNTVQEAKIYSWCDGAEVLRWRDTPEAGRSGGSQGRGELTGSTHGPLWWECRSFVEQVGWGSRRLRTCGHTGDSCRSEWLAMMIQGAGLERKIAGWVQISGDWPHVGIWTKRKPPGGEGRPGWRGWWRMRRQCQEGRERGLRMPGTAEEMAQEGVSRLWRGPLRGAWRADLLWEGS